MRLYLQIGTLKGKSFSVIDNATDIDNQIIYLNAINFLYMHFDVSST